MYNILKPPVCNFHEVCSVTQHLSDAAEMCCKVHLIFGEGGKAVADFPAIFFKLRW